MTGTIESITDNGSVVTLYIKNDGGGIDTLSGDGNMTRYALADSGLTDGDRIEYTTEGWGDLQWFAPLD